MSVVPSAEALKAKLRTAAGDRATAIADEEGEFLFRLLRDRQLKRTIEVGFAYGFSAAYIIGATGSAHVAIDPNPEAYGNLGLRNLEALGLDHLCHLEQDAAHAVLPRMLASRRRFDFAFVDGDHKFDTTLVEFYYLDLLLDAGGLVLFHDAWMPSIQHVASWIRANKANYHSIDTRQANLILFGKNGDDHRAWNHFADFAVRRPLLSGIKTRVRSWHL
jgi:predicted O-methyltransferase YrrM